ncbi:MAG: hypothetical protein N2323_04660 [candidate division WOR-3 bacterium]|nr:hypothetical protein [candidate division WOR-3 bacterium]MCX7837233.1 hypothetical protein [candidate division WOR-3 bacterium]MDW8113432.1 hypothetical protein [candidate division WOR-3 bacterium]
MEIKNFSLFILLIFFSCHINEVGREGVKERVGSDTLIFLNPITSDIFGKSYPCGGGQGLFLGKNDFYECRILLNFSLDTSFKNSEEIKLILYPKYYSSITFKVYPIILEWNENEVTWRLASSFVRWINYGGDYYELLLGEGETKEDSTVIELNPHNFDTLFKINYGVILIPQNKTEKFISFYSRTEIKPPKLYLRKNNRDTIFNLTANAYIVDTLFKVPENYFVIGSGYPFFSYLKFDLNNLSKETNIINADLFLYPETESSYFPLDSNEIVILKLTSDYLINREKASYEIYKRTLILRRDTIIKIDIKSLINFWKEKPDSNFGLFLSLYPFNSYPRFLLIKKEDKKMPRIEIFYFLKPKERL